MAKPHKEPMVTVYSPSGEPASVTRLNALDLTRHSGFTWEAGEPKPVQKAPAVETFVTVSEPTERVAEPAPTTESATSDPAPGVTDKDDLAEFLGGHDVAELRTILEEQFDERPHGRTGKDKLIQRIVELQQAAEQD